MPGMSENAWGLVGGGFRENCFWRIEKPDEPLAPPGVLLSVSPGYPLEVVSGFSLVGGLSLGYVGVLNLSEQCSHSAKHSGQINAVQPLLEISPITTCKRIAEYRK